MNNRPWATIVNSKKEYEDISFPTYAKLLRDMRSLLERSYTDRVTVTRTRRGEWGQYYEVWEKDKNNKPIKTKGFWL
jgi:hypothetical protein